MIKYFFIRVFSFLLLKTNKNISFLKSDDVCDAFKYRPISLLSNFNRISLTRNVLFLRETPVKRMSTKLIYLSFRNVHCTVNIFCKQTRSCYSFIRKS